MNQHHIGKVTMSDNYRTIRIPIELVEEVEKFIKAHPELGYKSNAEFVKEALRRRILELRKELPSE